MQWRAGPAFLVAVLVVLSGFAGPAGAGSLVERAAAGQSEGGSQAPTAELCDDGSPDPETDVLGWEAGCWYDQSIDVNQSDGINDTELDAIVARSMARVEHVRQLEFESTVPVEIRSREEFRAEQANRTTEPTLRAFDNAKFEALFLVGEDEDSIAVQNENSGSNILGFYSPSSEAIVVISENPDALQVEELTLAHELVHALQDQHFNLSRYDARTRDGANAESGLIEGDARLVEHRYRQHCEVDGAWNGTCLSPPGGDGGGGGELANIGTYLMKYQPYSDGPTFITSLYDDGGWESVNGAYEDPPASSEQVIHPERYRSDDPTNVALEDRHGDPWERLRPPDRPDHGTVGEAAVFVMLWYPGYDSRRQVEIVPYESFLNTTGGEVSSFQPYIYDSQYSAGWDGDRLHVYENDANETAYVWRLVWDSPAEASEFVDGYRQVLSYWGGERVAPNTWVVEDVPYEDAFHVSVRDDTVTIVNAPTTEQLPQVREGVEVTPTPSPTPTETLDPTTGSGSSGQGNPDGPSPSTALGGEPTSPGQPGFGALVALAALTIAMRVRRNG